MNTPQVCPLVCVVNGCECPAGTVINEETNSCVPPSDCPGTGTVCYVSFIWTTIFSYDLSYHHTSYHINSVHHPTTCRYVRFTYATWWIHHILYSLCGGWSGPHGVCISMYPYMLKLSHATTMSCHLCNKWLSVPSWYCNWWVYQLLCTSFWMSTWNRSGVYCVMMCCVHVLLQLLHLLHLWQPEHVRMKYIVV